MSFVTCAICDHPVKLVPDGILVFCPCNCLGVDCTPEYTRYIRTIPKEAPSYQEWLLQNHDTIEKLRAITPKYQNLHHNTIDKS